MSPRKRRPHKPTGETGPVRVSRARGTPQFDPIPFPSTKEEVERYVARPFVQSAATDPDLFPFTVLGELKQNPTDDFDFTLQTSAGEKYLELMEIDLRDIVEGSPHGSYRMDVAAELIVDRILAKSKRYATSRGLILLTYVTHWQFSCHSP